MSPDPELDRLHRAKMEELMRRHPGFSENQLHDLGTQIMVSLLVNRVGAGQTNSATTGVDGMSPTVLNPASRPDVFAALKGYEAHSTSTITGWRAWRVENRMTSAQRPELRLVSVGYNMVWEPRKQHEANCARGGRHIAPDWNCHCGIWAFKSVEEMQQVLQLHQYEGLGVLGTISLWGKVIETEHGFRAQYAYPKELWLDEEMLELGWTYKIPIRAATIRRDPPALINQIQ